MKRWQQVVLLILLLILPPLIFTSSKRQPRDHNLLDRIVLTAILPIQLAFDAIFDLCYEGYDHYAGLRYAYEENKILRLKLHDQYVTNLLAAEQVKENERLRLLLNYTHNPGFTYLTANTIATGPSPFFHSLTINRGEKDGVTIGAAVIVPTGVVGRVVALAPHSATVSLVTDPNSSFDVLIRRTRSRGRVVGLGDNHRFSASLDYILRTDDIALGDMAITSGLDGIFPKGLPIGHVVEIHKRHYGLHQELILEAEADFAHLEEVLLLIPETAPDSLPGAEL